MRSRPLWHWWQLLSLDAPSVAVTWALLLARCAGIPVHASDIFALGAAAWLIYAADRTVDGIVPRPGERLQERHRYHPSHRRTVSCLGMFVLIFLAYLFVEQFGSWERWAILLLLCSIGLYFAWIHSPSQKLTPGGAKHLVVGLIFSAGTFFSVWTHRASGGVAISAAALLFGFLCTLNGRASRTGEARRIPSRRTK